ncbi:hypothetical protein SAY86_027027 [Trapa natans]|uniref:Uncharacterized protein n=1 Tax=Trapa natans TaxID=22666 RepID=A0AAN7KTM0_TRANT|nr:hypothetical protein SAY86_027027 [Trapa natans]
MGMKEVQLAILLGRRWWKPITRSKMVNREEWKAVSLSRTRTLKASFMVVGTIFA